MDIIPYTAYIVKRISEFFRLIFAANLTDERDASIRKAGIAKEKVPLAVPAFSYAFQVYAHCWQVYIVFQFAPLMESDCIVE